MYRPAGSNRAGQAGRPIDGIHGLGLGNYPNRGWNAEPLREKFRLEGIKIIQIVGTLHASPCRLVMSFALVQRTGGKPMSENPAQTVNREFFLSKMEECIRNAEEAEGSAVRTYWLALADRWRTLAESGLSPNAWDRSSSLKSLTSILLEGLVADP